MIINLCSYDQSFSQKNDCLFVYEATNNVKKQINKQKHLAMSKEKPFGTSHAPVVTTQGNYTFSLICINVY